MRFIKNGPSIPDELLTAHDAGQVIIFCGAGVSLARAKLPTFVALAEEVLASLGSSQVSPARQLFNAAKKTAGETGVPGLLPTDRVFGMLEREFEKSDVQEAVALALKPPQGCSLSAHKILLDLSRTASGQPRIVTTNFDLLFEACEPDADSYRISNLPDPRRDIDFRGIMHLHGCVNESYDGAQNNEFILSSAEFGHAYLSDGWATRYIQTLLKSFKIVFIGYSAGDPPVQYLLEALNQFEKPNNKLYAFQAGTDLEAAAQWTHKGVTAIAFDADNDFAALWQTLEAWAERAHDPDVWHKKIIAMAKNGPANLEPFERGQIAHLASTIAGSEFISASNPPIPAEWLFVFDRYCRYGRVGKVSDGEGSIRHFDPFDEYGLDCDEPPIPVDPEDIFRPRELPEGVWHALESTLTDRLHLPRNGVAQLSSPVEWQPMLSPRLRHLGHWIANVANEPYTLWWSAGQEALHSEIVTNIKNALIHRADSFFPIVREGWRLLIKDWKEKANDDKNIEKAILETRINIEGWSLQIIKEAINLYRPSLLVERTNRIRPPISSPEIKLQDILSVSINYPQIYDQFAFPNEMLIQAVNVFRLQLEYVVLLEKEIYRESDFYVDSIRSDDDYIPDQNICSLTSHLVMYTNIVLELSKVDVVAARREASKWNDSDTVCTRLRIWFASRKEFTTPEQAAEIFIGLSEKDFWGSSHERDLLFALRDRWSQLNEASREVLERLILNGHYPYDESIPNLQEIYTISRLNYLSWFGKHGLKFSFDSEAEIERLRTLVPEWNEKEIRFVAQPQVGNVHGIMTDSNPASIENLPISDVLEKALKTKKHKFGSKTISDPFVGLVNKKPSRALAVLSNAYKNDIFYSWAWSSFLHSSGDAAKTPRMLLVVGNRLARLTQDQISALLFPISEWLRTNSEQIFATNPDIFNTVFERIVDCLKTQEEKQFPSERNRRLVNEGLNSPVGHVITAMFNDPNYKDLIPNSELPDLWKRRFSQLLALPYKHKEHAIALISLRINWLFHVDPTWVIENLIPGNDRTQREKSAFWAGFFATSWRPQIALFQTLKSEMTKFATTNSLSKQYVQNLAEMLLSGWLRENGDTESETIFSNFEFREILIHTNEEVQIKIIFTLQRWVAHQDSKVGDSVIPFLTNVWPKQLALRTERISAQLCKLAFGLPAKFAEIVGAIRNRLIPFRGMFLHVDFLNLDLNIFKDHPKALLDLLSVILLENPNEWPMYTSDFLSALNAHKETSDSPRLQELLRIERRKKY